ncbi:DUF2442 domain-containing protein [Paraburkholderia sp.]|uniref:DUF2442 domain-containing protein n=1 Tax=Paraburkholderia sp. TaxID=1926495 RepID=UPI0025CF5465|nr:DUF2442 domain-containing protein [Paraburkholderia sp.]
MDNKHVRATAIRFEDGQFVVTLSGGSELVVPLAQFPTLGSATRSQLESVRISPSGRGLHWDELDEDISVDGLLRDQETFRR